MTIQRIEIGARMGEVVIHGDTVYLAGYLAKAGWACRSPSCGVRDHQCGQTVRHVLRPRDAQRRGAGRRRDHGAAFLDNYEGKRTGRQQLFPVATVLNGKRAPARA